MRQCTTWRSAMFGGLGRLTVSQDGASSSPVSAPGASSVRLTLRPAAGGTNHLPCPGVGVPLAAPHLTFHGSDTATIRG